MHGIPTTAGTGTEIGLKGGVLLDEKRMLLGIPNRDIDQCIDRLSTSAYITFDKYTEISQ